MLNPNEIVMLFLGIGVMIFILSNKKIFNKLFNSKMLGASFGFFLLASICTNLEVFLWPTLINFVEHISYLASSIFLLFWIYKTITKEKTKGH